MANTRAAQIKAKVVELLGALKESADGSVQIPALGGVYTSVRQLGAVNDQPSLDVELGEETSEPRASFGATEILGLTIWLWGRQGESDDTDNIAERIKLHLSRNLELGGLVTELVYRGMGRDEGHLGYQGLGCLRVLRFSARYETLRR